MTAPLSPAPALTAEEAVDLRALDAARDAAVEMAFDWYCPNVPDMPRRQCVVCVAEVAATAALAALRGDRAPLAGQHTTAEEGR